VRILLVEAEGSEDALATLFVSGYSEDASGADRIKSADFLPKPFGLEQLANTVRDALARHDSATAA